MKPNDIKDYADIHYDLNVWKDYKWVQVAKRYPSGGWTTWAWTEVEKLADFRKRRKSTLIFNTIGHFIEADKESLQLSDSCFECDVEGETDFEKRQNFKRMQNTIDELYSFFADLGIEDGQIRFFFTGGRSIHVVVMHQPFGIEPMIELNLVMKHIAKYFNDGLLYGDEYHPLDESLYSNPKMFRMPNSYYPKYDAWKVEISPREINLPEAELRKLAKKPRAPLYELSDIPTEQIPEAGEWYQERLQELQELQKEREHIPVDPRVLKNMIDIPACIADLRTNTISENDKRNQATLLDSTFCKSTGVPKDEAFVLINEWVQRIPDALTDRRRGRQREIATKSVVESVYRGKKYKFACRYARALELECSQEACPLYNQKAFQKWNKRVKVIPNFTPTYKTLMVSIMEESDALSRLDELRKKLADKVSENGHNLLLHAPPGTGKTETTLRTLDPMSNILYSPPRREMLDHPMSLITHSACELIKPREPTGPKPHKDDPVEVKEAYYASALCKYYKKANALAAKRWNVAKELCTKRCDIGIEKCPYWQQFKVWGSSLVTHHILLIPHHMESLVFGNNPTIVFDEPNVATLIEQVDITPKTITQEMGRWRGEEIISLLKLLRKSIENHDGEYETGKAMIEKLKELRLSQTAAVDAYDGDLSKLLDDAIQWVQIPSDYIEIRVDSISTQSTEKAWLVIIDGVEYWIPRRLCFESDISEKKIMIPYWFADQKGITYRITDSDTEEDTTQGEIPLNFLRDLVSVLYEEFDKFKRGENFNSQLALLKKTFNENCLRMNLRRKLPPITKNHRIILLDAFGDVELLSKLTGRQLEAWTMPIAIDAEVIQITDGYYGITTMWKKKAKSKGGGIPKTSLEKRLIPAARNIASQDPEGTVIITWKLIRQYIEKLQQESKFDNRVEIDHFGNIKGSNKHEHKRQVIIIGAPSIQVEDLLQIANCIWHDDEELINDEMIKDGNWRPYQYREEETGNGYAVEVREFKDKRLNLLLKTYREYEIAQAAHRIRPLLYPGEKKIWLLTNLPIDELPPTQLTTLDEIIAEMNPMFVSFKNEVERIQSQHSGVWREYLKIRMCTRVIEYNTIYKDAQAKNPARETLNRWFQKAVELLGYESTIVTIGGNVRLKVYHNGNLDQDKIRKLYHKLQEAKNESKKET